MNHAQTFDISLKTLFKFLLFAFCIYLFYTAKDIFIWLLFAFIISMTVEPAIQFLEKIRIPRFLAAILIYILLFVLIGATIYFLAKYLIDELSLFSSVIFYSLQKITTPLKSIGIDFFENVEDFIEYIKGKLIVSSKSIWSAVFSFFGGIFAFFNIFLFSLLLSLEGDTFEVLISAFLPKDKREEILENWHLARNAVSKWFGVRILSCFFIGSFTFLILKFLKVNYSFLLGFLAGITNIIPILGPLFSGVLIFLISSIQSFTISVFATISFILLQAIESNLISPFLTSKFLKIPSIFILLAVLFGGKLFGILGSILAIPIFAVFYQFAKEITSKE
jgi:predicted PurR-regulated permease PerM